MVATRRNDKAARVRWPEHVRSQQSIGIAAALHANQRTIGRYAIALQPIPHDKTVGRELCRAFPLRHPMRARHSGPPYPAVARLDLAALCADTARELAQAELEARFHGPERRARVRRDLAMAQPVEE